MLSLHGQGASNKGHCEDYVFDCAVALKRQGGTAGRMYCLLHKQGGHMCWNARHTHVGAYARREASCIGSTSGCCTLHQQNTVAEVFVCLRWVRVCLCEDGQGRVPQYLVFGAASI